MKQLIQTIRLLILGLIMLNAVGCAMSGPKFSDLRASMSPPAAGKGRIYIYRTTILGAAVQPTIWVNGDDVGSAQPLAFHMIDRPAGTYKIVTSTEVSRSLSLTLEPNQTRYVRLNLSFGFLEGHVYPELIESTVAEKEIANCRQRTK